MPRNRNRDPLEAARTVRALANELVHVCRERTQPAEAIVSLLEAAAIVLATTAEDKSQTARDENKAKALATLGSLIDYWASCPALRPSSS